MIYAFYPWKYNACPKTRHRSSDTRTGIRIALSAPYPHTICPPCAAGGKKTSSRHNVTTTRCSDITVPLPPLPRPNFVKRLYASTCKAIPYLPSSPCRTGCRWTANGATPMRRKNASMYPPIRATTGAGVCT